MFALARTYSHIYTHRIYTYTYTLTCNADIENDVEIMHAQIEYVPHCTTIYAHAPHAYSHLLMCATPS